MKNQQTFGQTRQVVEQYVAAEYKGLVLSEEGIATLEDFFFTPLAYGEVRRCSAEIKTLNGRTTKKCLQVVVTRLDNGIYEPLAYCL